MEYFRINLQLFANEAEETAEETVVEEEEITEETEQEETQEEAKEEVKEDSKSVPLEVFLAEKRRRKELEKRQRELESSQLGQDLAQEKQRFINELVADGVDETIAEKMFKPYEKLYQKVNLPKSTDDLIVEEIRDLADYGEYKDAMQYKDQIIEKVKSLDNKITVEDAYALVTKDKKKTREHELRTQIEQENAIKKRQAQADKTMNASPTKTEGISNEDRKTLERLQKLYPDRAWTPQKIKEYKSLIG